MTTELGQVVQVLQSELQRGNSRGGLVVRRDGILLANEGTGTIDAESLAAMAAAIFGAAEVAGTSAGASEPEHVELQYQGLVMIITAYDPEHLIVRLTGDSS